MGPKCPECRAPVERRGNHLICSDRTECRSHVEPWTVLLICPECGEDAWMDRGSIKGKWQELKRGGRRLVGTARVRCKAGHSGIVPLPIELQPTIRRERRTRRAF